ncbi:hypothetical protein [Planococcus lenghuensis]|uniref:Uncharacterized protein n=1 Tax=Planococcus lenghuensis TaxID=2213202 RepID=A0A1Q2KZ97_9BACL|nr:hypothetical protein [Planococcus lenghuensis]AQQ53127.1 hypothetical protein B0X71_08480 [Planococcus lenghuensis]
MHWLTRFVFWLPFLSLMIIGYELLVRPVTHPWAGIDPLYVYALSALPDAFRVIPLMLMLHFLFAVLYGVMWDALVKRIY